MKPGKNTTEFWLTVAFMALVAANGTDFINIPWEHVLAMGGVTGIYTAGRTFAKKGGGT